MTDYYDKLETRDPAERERNLIAQVAAQVAHAKSAAPAYAELLADIDAGAINSAAAIAELPVTRKTELLALQKERPPFGGFSAVSGADISYIFASPGPIYEPVEGGLLAVWDVSSLADRDYTLRVVAFDSVGNGFEARTWVVVQNPVPTPTSIPSFTPSPTWTPIPSATATGTATMTPVPTDTPWPTETPTPAPTATGVPTSVIPTITLPTITLPTITVEVPTWTPIVSPTVPIDVTP